VGISWRDSSMMRTLRSPISRVSRADARNPPVQLCPLRGGRQNGRLETGRGDQAQPRQRVRIDRVRLGIEF
jgi:hypothetical protein